MTGATLFYGASTKEADLLYLSGFAAPDPFAFALVGEQKVLFASDLEYDRARRTARADQVVRFMEIQKELQEKGENRTDALACAARWLADRGVDRLEVPGTFPLEGGDWLREAGFAVTPAAGSLAPGRRCKGKEEIELIRRTQEINEEAVRQGIELIGAAGVADDGTLTQGGEPLTSERVRAAIQTALAARDCFSEGTIVAGGEQACDPHDAGSGPLRAGTFIIIDVFPRSLVHFHHADMTRTVLKGRARPEQRAHYEAVLAGQEWAIGQIAAGAAVREIHLGIHRIFAERGFESGLIEGRMQGFFHGTGHGVGLEIHEAPRFSDCDGAFAAGDVVTVEPGLYYAGRGGVRIEDMVVVEEGGCRNLTRMAKDYEVE